MLGITSRVLVAKSIANSHSALKRLGRLPLAQSREMLKSVQKDAGATMMPLCTVALGTPSHRSALL